jgi:hypothetical protein
LATNLLILPEAVEYWRILIFVLDRTMEVTAVSTEWLFAGDI